MITIEGIVGRLVSFIVNKSAGKFINLSSDKRLKACRSLTKLYYCVQTLDDITEDVYKTISDFDSSTDAEAMFHALNNNMHKIEQASNMFMELGGELHAGLDIIDPALAQCCNTLYISKFDFLSFMSTSIKWDRSPEGSTILVTLPPSKMLDVDLDDMYTQTEVAINKGDKNYWPSSALNDFSENDISTIRISFEDAQAANHLKEHLDSHRMLLQSAKESLRKLLKDNFSIEEVLFQNGSHPWR